MLTARPASIRRVAPTRPLDWIGRGWADLRRAFVPSILHGVLLVIGAAVIVALGWGRGWLLSGAFSGFVLIAPSLLTGLYELSRRLESGEPVGVGAALEGWRRAGLCPMRFGILLAVIGTIWVAVSALVVWGARPPDMTGAGGGVTEFLRFFFLGEYSALFLAWVMAGGLLAALVFAISVVSVPMMLDHRVRLPSAIATSVQAVAENPVTMAFWAVLIMVLTLVGLATGIGIVLLIPLLGHASWHAYRDLVEPTSSEPALDKA